MGEHVFKKLGFIQSRVGFNLVLIFGASGNKRIRTKDLYELYQEVFGKTPIISFIRGLQILQRNGWARKTEVGARHVEWEINPVILGHVGLIKKIVAAREKHQKREVLYLRRFFRESVLGA